MTLVFNFQIASKDLAHCLGLTVGVRYRVKEQPPQTLPSTETETETVSLTSALGHLAELVVAKQVVSPTLPPRKRLKMSQVPLTATTVAETNTAVGNGASSTNSDSKNWTVPLCSADETGAETVQLPRSPDVGAGPTGGPVIAVPMQVAVESGHRAANADYFSVSLCNAATPPPSTGVHRKPIVVPTAQVFQQPGAVVTATQQPRANPQVAAARSAVQPVGRASSTAKRGRRPQQMMSVLRPELLNRTVPQAAVKTVADDKNVLAAFLQQQQQHI